MRPAASELRSSDVRVSDSNGARFGSYGSETVTSVRPASASSSAHCAPVRSSKPYAKTGRPPRRRARRRRGRPRGAGAGRGPRARAARALRGTTRRDARGRRRSWSGSTSPDSSSAERRAERIREAGEARGGAEAVQRRCRDRGADDQLALGVGRDREIRAPGAGDLARRGRRRSRSGPTSSAPRFASSSRSMRSTSDPCGTISIGSRSSAPR